MRRFVLRDPNTADVGVALGGFALYGTILALLGWSAASFRPDPSWPWWLWVLVVMFGLTAFVPLLVSLLWVGATLLDIKSVWAGHLIVTIDGHGVRLPHRVPWSEITAIAIGPAERFSDRTAIIVGIVSGSRAQARAFDAVATRVGRCVRGPTAAGSELAERFDELRRWQRSWAQVDQPIGFRVVAGGPVDVATVRALTNRYAPHVPVLDTLPTNLDGHDTPHGAMARLAEVVQERLNARPD